VKTVIEIGARHTGQPPLLCVSFDEHSSQLTRWPQSKRVVRDADMQTMQSGKKAFVSTFRRSLARSFVLVRHVVITGTSAGTGTGARIVSIIILTGIVIAA